MYVLTAPPVGGWCCFEVHVELVLACCADGNGVRCKLTSVPLDVMHHYLTKQPNDKLRRLYELSGLKIGD